MDRNNDKYFTIWYGVYHRATRELVYASGGHHAAVAVSGSEITSLLQGNGPAIGALPESKYPAARAVLPPSTDLYLFSDGVYEIARPDGELAVAGGIFAVPAGEPALARGDREGNAPPPRREGFRGRFFADQNEFLVGVPSRVRVD